MDYFQRSSMDNLTKGTVVRLKKMEEHALYCMKEKNRLCHNQDVSVHTGIQDEKKLVFTWVNVNDGCENDKRHASKYCQDCSNKYKK